MSVARLNSHLQAMQAPETLRQLVGWVLWRYEAGDGAKPRKVPYYADGGRRHGVQGRREDRLRMVTFDAAKAAAARRGFDGVGFCLLPEFGVTCIDFDNVVDARGLRPDVAELVADTYAEFSPGGNGAHAWYLGNEGNYKSHGEPFGVEAFSTSGFVTFTGNPLPHVADLELAGPVDLVPMAPALRSLCASRFGSRAAQPEDDDPLMSYQPPLGLTEDQIREALEVLPPDMGHDDWLKVGMALHHETGGEGFHLWDEWSSGGGDKYPGTEVLQRRWDSFRRETGRRIAAGTLVKMANAAGARIRVGEEVVTAEALAVKPADQAAALRFLPVRAGEFSRGKPIEWLIKGVLPQAQLGAIYGEPGAGKSFFALDLVLAVARGVEWRGRRVKRGRVVYIVAEGASGFRLRLRAAAEFHGFDIDQVDIWIIDNTPNLLEAVDIKDLVAALRTVVGVVLVVVDTLAQTTPGADENSGKDMGRAIAHCKAISQALSALVLLVAHSGKDASRGVRGWSGIKGALDVEIVVERCDQQRAATVTKMKDGEGEAHEFGFSLQSVVLGQDDEGDDISSMVIVEAAGGRPSRAVPRDARGAVQRLVLRLAGALTGLGGEVTATTLIDTAINELPPAETGKKDNRRRDVMRALESLVAAGTMSLAGGVVSLQNIAR